MRLQHSATGLRPFAQSVALRPAFAGRNAFRAASGQHPATGLAAPCLLVKTRAFHIVTAGNLDDVCSAAEASTQSRVPVAETTELLEAAAEVAYQFIKSRYPLHAQSTHIGDALCAKEVWPIKGLTLKALLAGDQRVQQAVSLRRHCTGSGHG